MRTPVHSWVLNRPTTSPFALPRGMTGRIAGRIMLWTNKQPELLDLLDVQPGSRVLEVGYGPGAFIRLLLERFPEAQICGIDPSPEMRDMASRHNADGIAAGRVDLRVGTAEAAGLPDESIDHVVSVNNVALWPDLHAGLRELHRVLRPGGTVLIAWHSRTAPSPIARRIGLPENILDRLREELQKMFGDVSRHDLKHTVAFTAIRPDPESAVEHDNSADD